MERCAARLHAVRRSAEWRALIKAVMCLAHRVGLDTRSSNDWFREEIPRGEK